MRGCARSSQQEKNERDNHAPTERRRISERTRTMPRRGDRSRTRFHGKQPEEKAEKNAKPFWRAHEPVVAKERGKL